MAASLSRAVVCVVVVCLLAARGVGWASAQAAMDADAYVAFVLASHPTLSQQQGLAAAAAAERSAVRLWPDPVVSFSGARGRATDAPAERGAETDLAVSQTIPWPATFRAGKRVGETTAQTYEANAESLRWDLAATARQAFARLVAARAVVEIARAVEQDARSLRDLVTQRADLGESRESDRIKATVEWLRQQRALATAEREASAAELIVRTLAVQSLPRPLVLAGAPSEAVPTVRTDLVAGDLANLNPRVQAVRAEAERQRALLGVAKASRAPNLDVSVFRSDEIDKASTGVSLGLRLPLWNANRGDIARSSAAATVAGAEAERLRLEIATELELRLRDLQIAADQVTLLQGELLTAAQRSVDLARFSYEEGETSLLDLLDAQRTFRDTQRELADARLALSLALAEAQRLAGPGFMPWK